MIRLRGAGVRYGDRWALRGVDLELPERKVVVLGANGSGKSTLARLLNGLVHPTEGEVEVDGLDPVRSGHEVRRRVGFVFTDPDAQIVMPTVAEDVAFSLRRLRLARDEADARVRAVLARFGLADHHDHPAHLLSGGQKQLLALASVLVTEPQVLVCDEPTTLLDLRNTRMVGDLLLGLDEQVVLVTHDLDLVDGWDRVVVVDQGRVVADGPPAATVARYRELVS
jgi:biotin transport system ATP-binding protein